MLDTQLLVMANIICSEDIIDDSWRINIDTYAHRLSNGRWHPYPYLISLAKQVQEAIVSGNSRIIIQAPPRHGKSEFISRWVPTWYLDMFPEKRVMLASYEATFAATWGAKVRNELMTNEETWANVRQDKKASNDWLTMEGGGMVTAGVGGPITGRGFDLGIIDDPVKNWEEAHSAAGRRKRRAWFDSTFYTRGEPGSTILVLMTRWHEDDLGGYLVGEHADDWQVIRLPALAEADDSLGREEGEALCPERYPAPVLERIRDAVGTSVWQSLYQQSPAPDEGLIIKKEWWQHYTETPQLEEIIQSWDMTFKNTKDSDFVVGQVWGRSGADKYLLDQIRGRLSFVDTLEAIRDLSRRYPMAHAKIVEDKANGPAVISALSSEITGIIPYNPRGSKLSRVNAVSPQIESGNVYLPLSSTYPWVDDYIYEWSVFPNGKHDDQVDATSQALIRFGSSGSNIFMGRA